MLKPSEVITLQDIVTDLKLIITLNQRILTSDEKTQLELEEQTKEISKNLLFQLTLTLQNLLERD